MYASVCQSVGDVTWPAAGDPQVCYSLLQTPVRRTHAVALQSPVIKHLVCVHLQFQSLRFYARLSYDKSVSLSVCLSVTFWYCVEIVVCIVKPFHHLVVPSF